MVEPYIPIYIFRLSLWPSLILTPRRAACCSRSNFNRPIQRVSKCATSRSNFHQRPVALLNNRKRVLYTTHMHRIKQLAKCISFTEHAVPSELHIHSSGYIFKCDTQMSLATHTDLIWIYGCPAVSWELFRFVDWLQCIAVQCKAIHSQRSIHQLVTVYLLAEPLVCALHGCSTRPSLEIHHTIPRHSATCRCQVFRTPYTKQTAFSFVLPCYPIYMMCMYSVCKVVRTRCTCSIGRRRFWDLVDGWFYTCRMPMHQFGICFFVGSFALYIKETRGDGIDFFPFEVCKVFNYMYQLAGEAIVKTLILMFFLRHVTSFSYFL